MTGDDLLLLHRWREGDRTAGDALIRRHYASAYRLALRLLDGDADGAQECSQRAFETLLHKRGEIENNVKGYLRRVAMLKVLSFRRTRHAMGGASLLEAGGRDLESALAQQEEIKLMVKALRRLSLDDQLLLAWAYGDEKTQREIAASLELGLAQCNMRLYRARQRLKQQLEVFRASPVREATLGGFETWLASVHGRRH
jgi:RNA polymerase sigma factor (sigma-70 family)